MGGEAATLDRPGRGQQLVSEMERVAAAAGRCLPLEKPLACAGCLVHIRSRWDIHMNPVLPLRASRGVVHLVPRDDVRDLRAQINPLTRALIHTYQPIRLYVYDHRHYPRAALNPLVKALLLEEPLFQRGQHLFELAPDPGEADLFVFPCDLDFFETREERVYDQIGFYPQNERRHLFYDTRDAPSVFPSRQSICLKTSLYKKDASVSTICMPYLDVVDDFFAYFLEPRTIKYELSFVGQRTPLREKIVESLGRLPRSSRFVLRDGFYFRRFADGKEARAGCIPGRSDPSERAEYIEIMRQSRFALALPGYGLNSFRFFEALSLGVPPILVADDIALPFESFIDYGKFCIRVAASSPSLPEDIEAAIDNISEEAYSDMCLWARLHYDAFLSARSFLFLLHDALSHVIGG